MATKIMQNYKPKLHILFISVQDMEAMFAYIVGFSCSANSNVLIKILREQRGCHSNDM